MDTITIHAGWWCPSKRLPQTKEDLRNEICRIAASHIAFEVTEYDAGDCYVSAVLRVLIGEEDDGEEG